MHKVNVWPSTVVVAVVDDAFYLRKIWVFAPPKQSRLVSALQIIRIKRVVCTRGIEHLSKKNDFASQTLPGVTKMNQTLDSDVSKFKERSPVSNSLREDGKGSLSVLQTNTWFTPLSLRNLRKAMIRQLPSFRSH